MPLQAEKNFALSFSISNSIGKFYVRGRQDHIDTDILFVLIRRTRYSIQPFPRYTTPQSRPPTPGPAGIETDPLQKKSTGWSSLLPKILSSEQKNTTIWSYCLSVLLSFAKGKFAENLHVVVLCFNTCRSLSNLLCALIFPPTPPERWRSLLI